MARVVVVGGGIGGQVAALLLAGDGHDVTLLERDAAPPPDDPRDAWVGWERRGVAQFRLLHSFLPRLRALLEEQLPDVPKALDGVGALRTNSVLRAPVEVSGGHQPGDERFDLVTARRPVFEAAMASVLDSSTVDVRRGTAVAGLLADGGGAAPHVVGVALEGGGEVRADLVVDASGRRSALPRWLQGIGARPPVDEAEDCGFVYFGRHYRSGDGSVPPNLGSLMQHHGSFSVFTLPADNGTWGCGITTTSEDGDLRARLRDPAAWEALWRACPLTAHWLDGEALDPEPVVMARIEDRIRHLVVDGQPVATGVVAVADAWSCTNPSVGRGASIGALQAVELRDLLREGSPIDRGFSVAFAERTAERVEPWYRATLHHDRHRLGAMQADRAGTAYEPDDPLWERWCRLEHAFLADPRLFRAYVGVMSLYDRPQDVFADEGVAADVDRLGAGWREAPRLGPDRQQALALVGA